MSRHNLWVMCLTLILVGSFFKISHSQNNETDYSSYYVAKQYQRNNNLLLAYKFLIIFKYTNLDRLKKPLNHDALAQIDNEINQLEKYLSITETVVISASSSARGFNAYQLDSLLKAQRSKVEQFKDVRIIN